ncbi:MAG: phage terminase large subunit [Rhodospirillaceae bacterium]
MTKALPPLSRLCQVCPPDYPEDEVDYSEAGVSAVDFVPLTYQHDFLNFREPNAAMIGGLGIGKTHCGARRAYDFAVLANQEPHYGIVGAPTYPMLRDVTIPKVAEVFPSEVLEGGRWDLAYSKSEKVLRLVTGTQIVFRSLDGENYNKLRGIEAAWLWVDEAGLLKTADAWNVARGRVRGRARIRGAWATMTPKGDNWAAQRWITDPLDGYSYVHATAYDNPYLPREYIKQLEATYSETFLRQELYGEVVSLQGAVYPDLSDALWPDGNVLVYEADPHRDTELWIDFGIRNPRVLAIQSIGVIHPSDGKRRNLDVVVWELQDRNGRPPADMRVGEWLDKVQESGLRVRRVYGDPAGDSRNDQTHQTSAQLVRERFRCKFLAPHLDWQRSKERGEETVRNRVRSSHGERTLVWACKPSTNSLGKHELWAPNSFRSHRNLQYPDPKPGQPVVNESKKDGVNDHDTDASRYALVMKYGAQQVNLLTMMGRKVIG